MRLIYRNLVPYVNDSRLMLCVSHTSKYMGFLSICTQLFPFHLMPLHDLLRLIYNGPLQMMVERSLRVQLIRVSEEDVDRLESRSCSFWVVNPHNRRFNDVQRSRRSYIRCSANLVG